MFLDWLSIHQDHGDQLPLIADRAMIVIDTDTGDALTTTQPTITERGSYSTSVQIRLSGGRISVSGNPSRFNRPENLFGLTSIDQAVAVYNRILMSHGLPPFTKATKRWFRQGEDGKRAQLVSDGATITELHITTNREVGRGNVLAYLKGLSTQRLRHSIPRLHTNGRAVDWLSKKGNARLIYPSVYDKAHELRLHALEKTARSCGKDSDDYRYVQKVIAHCEQVGLVRFEQKIKSAYLRRRKLNHYGFVEIEDFENLHREFIAIDCKLKVTNMGIETLAEQLQREGICTNPKAANTTLSYAIRWMHGERFDLKKSKVKLHRARLRKIGIDIADTFDVDRHSLVHVRHVRDITVTDSVAPDWYQQPEVRGLRLVA